jgi:GTP-binding protein
MDLRSLAWPRAVGEIPLMPTTGPTAHRDIRGAEAERPALGASLVGSFPDPLVSLVPPLPEVALIGRSNVGKSTLLNTLVRQPGLARVSGTPGKTTLLNVYRLPTLYLIDPPGYGFARAGKSAREGYRRLLERLLTERRSLTGVVWLLDIRHGPSQDDLDIQQLLIRSGHPVLAVLTKADKLSRVAALARAAELAKQLGLEHDQVQLTSSRSGLGIEDLVASLTALAGEDR